MSARKLQCRWETITLYGTKCKHTCTTLCAFKRSITYTMSWNCFIKENLWKEELGVSTTSFPSLFCLLHNFNFFWQFFTHTELCSKYLDTVIFCYIFHTNLNCIFSKHYWHVISVLILLAANSELSRVYLYSVMISHVRNFKIVIYWSCVFIFQILYYFNYIVNSSIIYYLHNQQLRKRSCFKWK